MISQISIDNFKLFGENINIPLSRINLFTGINGRGKSSALQVLLLLSQSALQNRFTNTVLLNGANVSLGSFDDVKNKGIPFSEQICFGFTYDNFVVNYFLHSEQSIATELNIERIASIGKLGNDEFEFDLIRNDNLYKLTKKKSVGEGHEFSTSLFDLFISETSLVQYNNNLDLEYVRNEVKNLVHVHYVSADRLGPQNYYENKSLGPFLSIGALGENSVNLLYQKGEDNVDEIVLKGFSKIFGKAEEDLSRTIESNVNYWISEIFQGAQVRVESIRGEDLLKLRISSDSGTSYFKPTNVGYGFSYSLPIIVAGLIAKAGEILVVENPEAHLHPYAQSILAKFLSLVSEAGVQVLIESHSDHFLNGLRICVKDKIIESSSLKILYFDNKLDGMFDDIRVDEDGGISKWHPHFFDQTTRDLNYLLGL